MIDGVKIEVQALNGGDWLDCDLLDFSTSVSMNTGEVLTGSLYAKYKGLKFLLTPSQRGENGYYRTVRGSLHKFHNNGDHNGNDYTHGDLCDTLADLTADFNICLSSAYLRNIEIGVNIETPIPAQKIIHNLIACKNKAFEVLRIDNKKIGKVAHFSQFSIKVYDKGYQYDLGKDNILRVELSFRKMQALQKYDIATLADLQDIQKVRPLGALLIDYWNNIIYFDKAIKWKGLTDFERKKLLYYATPRNWVDFTIKQRYRAKKHYTELMAKHNVLSTHSEISEIIAEKWSDLTAEKCPQIYQNTGGICSRKMSINLHFKYRVSTGTNHTPKKKKENSRKTYPKNKRKCRVCKADISHKKTNSLYCSKKCNNSYHAHQRKLKRQMKKKKEIEQLAELLKSIDRSNWELLVTYEKDKIAYTDKLEQNEIQTTGDWIKCIKWVTVKTTPTESVLLTSYRARRLIKEINKLNNKKLKQ